MSIAVPTDFSVSGLRNYVKDNPGVTLLAAAVVIVVAVIIVYEINQSLTRDERVATDLAQADSVDDFDRLLAEHKGTAAEPQILLEKLLFLVEEGPDREPDYAAAAKVLDELNSPRFNQSPQNIVWADMVSVPLLQNEKFERELRAAKARAAKEKPADTEEDDEESADESGGSDTEAPEDSE